MVARKLRIGVLSLFFPPFQGGAEWVAYNTSKALAANGHHIDVYTLHHDEHLATCERFGNLTINRYPFSTVRRGSFTTLKSNELVHALRLSHSNIFHIHSITYPLLLLEAAKNIQVPTMLITHGIVEALKGNHKGLNRFIYRHLTQNILRRLFNSINFVGFSSMFEKNLADKKRLYFGHYAIVHNGVHLPKISKLEKSPHPIDNSNSPINLLHVARLVPYKGHKDVLQAISNMDNVVYHIVGSGGSLWQDYEDHLHYFIDENYSKKRVVLHGQVGESDKDQLYREADVVIVPSHMETFPLAVLEAMSYGKAVIASAVGGIPEIIKHNQNGYLIPANDPDSIREALYLLADPLIRKRLGKNAAQTINQQFTWDKVISKYETLSYKILEDYKYIQSDSLLK